VTEVRIRISSAHEFNRYCVPVFGHEWSYFDIQNVWFNYTVYSDIEFQNFLYIIFVICIFHSMRVNLRAMLLRGLAGSRGGSSGGRTRPPPLKLEKKIIVWRKIVIFHTKYPTNFFKCAPPNLKSWIRPWEGSAILKMWNSTYHIPVWQ
jgi:hypothetical protein